MATSQSPRRAAEDPQQSVKFVLVTGGVCSSIGKGVTTSTVGALLRLAGYAVTAIKIDPYINVDAGLMSPFEHGEVFVLDDGGEADLDLGNYERWMSLSLTRGHNITTGKVYDTLIRRERKGAYLGATVQMVPHFTNEVVETIKRVAALPVDGTDNKPQVCMIELGGTIGDIESTPFFESLRQLRFSLPPEDFILMHTTYLPVMGGVQKTKPSQHSVRTLVSLGMMPDFLICRCESALDDGTVSKLSQLCGVRANCIIDAHNAQNLYDVPLQFLEQAMVERIVAKLSLPPVCFPNVTSVPGVAEYSNFSAMLKSDDRKVVKVAFIGKYAKGGGDAYFSVMQTFEHCSMNLGVRIEYDWIDAEDLEDQDKQEDFLQRLKACCGIFVPGGFGRRGVEGKIAAVRIARENGIPYFGVCLGMQVAVVEIARNVLGIADAVSEELDDDKKSENHLVIYMPEIDRESMGANMRLGGRTCVMTSPGSKLSVAYSNAAAVRERHRHRYEFNMTYFDRMRAEGHVTFSGSDDASFGENTRIEAIELVDHPFFLAVQYHPEFRSSIKDPSPPYLAFVAHCAQVAPKYPTVNSRAVELPK
jgi:CTP synthase